MSNPLQAYVDEIESLLRMQEALQKAYVKLQGHEDDYIKGIIVGLNKALLIAQRGDS